MRTMRSSAAAWMLAMGVALAAFGAPRPAAAQQPPAATAPPLARVLAAATAPPLARVLAPLGDGDDASRRAAAEAASTLGDDATAAIGDELASVRRTSTAATRAALHAARDRGGDLEGALLDLAARRAADVDARGALEEVCLVRSLAHIGTTPAMRLLVLAADDLGGELRPELSRLVKQLGDRAIAALVEARLSPSATTKQWAAGMLDALGKHLPSDAVQTKDERALEDVLRAYGAVRDLDALPILLNFANAERAPLRTAARDAILLYGQDALWKLREQYQAVTGKPASEGAAAVDLARELFAAFDRVRLEEVYARLDEGLEKFRLGDPAKAASDFDAVLARQPELDRRAEMIPGYLAYARSIDADDPARARAYAERARQLGPDDGERADIDSELSYLDGKELEGRGVSGADAYRRAVALDPANARAAAELARIDAASASRQRKLDIGTAAGAVAAVGIAALVLFAGKSRTKKAGTRRRAPASSS
jgi:hypothetical protein